MLQFVSAVGVPPPPPPRYSTNSVANKTPKRRTEFKYQLQAVKCDFLATEWVSKYGDLSTMNRALAIDLAKVQKCKNGRVKVQVTFLVPNGTCSDQERDEAATFNVHIVEAQKRTGINRYAWLSFPTKDLKIDVVVGHDVMLGGQAKIIKEENSWRPRWVQVAHTDPKELSSRGQKEKEDMIELYENADLVMTVGPKLKDDYSNQLRGCEKDKNVFEFTPGIMEDLVIDQAARRYSATFKVLGRIDSKDFKQKGYSIAIELKDETCCLVFVCAPGKRVDEEAEYLRSACGSLKGSLKSRHL